MGETFRDFIRRGELMTVLDDWLPPFAGFFLYFPSRRTVEPKLRALIDHVRRFHEQAANRYGDEPVSYGYTSMPTPDA
ncbi:hypothetical protein D3C72_2382740 [compost metagenome]